MMKFILIMSLGLLSACASNPQKAPQDIILKPSDPETSLEIDEQFLKKSQRVGSTTTGKPVVKTLLTP